MTDYHGGRPEWPSEGQCFLCNQEIDFFAQDEWEVTLSFGHSPRGASRPGHLFFAHEACIRRSAHPDYEMQFGPR
jgi:hypothetical protein